jgi:predicted TIM-barrel fold metal-dependent hydrolase
MFVTADGEKIFVIDGHVHWWNGTAANQRNRHGEDFIQCFFEYHQALTHPDFLTDRSRFDSYSPEKMYQDLFVDGYDDMAIFQPTYLKAFYVDGFNTTEQNALPWQAHPERYILNGSFEPRDGEAGVEYIHALVEKYRIRGVKLYTAEWHGDSKGYKLTDPWAVRCLEACEKLGVRNIHVHKGPTIRPLNKDAFDVHDIDDVASAFPGLRFIVEHTGLPRLDDFTWIAKQDKNVYGGLAVAIAFIHTRPGYFAQIMAELLYWLGPDRLLFGSDYGIWHPKWIIEDFMKFQLSPDLEKEYGVTLDLTAKKKILGLNAAALYEINVGAQLNVIQATAVTCAEADDARGQNPALSRTGVR